MMQYINNERPTDRRSLINEIERSWNAIPQSKIQGYIDNLPTRLTAVEKAGGARLD
jgi:hypothetical protein